MIKLSPLYGPILGLLSLVLFSRAAHAASLLDGGAMNWPWTVPFLGFLLSIAAGPILFPRTWHHHYGKFALGWSLLVVLSIAVDSGVHTALAAFVHAMLAEYLSFIVLLFALYTVAGGILVTGNLSGRPLSNTAMLALGTAMASIVGTTGAAMILIRPIIRANANRSHNAHVVVFFIILVANVGGALSPLGDPPLFVGFLRGVDFFWTLQHLWLQTLIVSVVVLAAFLATDTLLAGRDLRSPKASRPIASRIGLRGGVNFLLIALIIAVVLGAAMWDPEVSFDVLGTRLDLQNIGRDIALLAIALLSLRITADEHREANGFSWEPFREVAILFAGIFTTIIPVLAILGAGAEGLFAGLLSAVTMPNGQPNEVAYFWMTGILSAFLDNAPTYLVFFELAGGDPSQLTGPLAGTLSAISMGAVYMGALTYIGNAPNFMVYAIATERGIRMPGFFGYLLWATIILVPLFVLLTLLPIAPTFRFT